MGKLRGSFQQIPPVAVHVEQHLHGCAQYDRPAYIGATYRLWLRALRVSWKKHPLHADAGNLDGANTHKVYSTLLDVPAAWPDWHLLAYHLTRILRPPVLHLSHDAIHAEYSERVRRGRSP